MDEAGFAVSFYVLAYANCQQPVPVAVADSLVGLIVAFPLTLCLNIVQYPFTHHCATNHYDITNGPTA